MNTRFARVGGFHTLPDLPNDVYLTIGDATHFIMERPTHGGATDLCAFLNEYVRTRLQREHAAVVRRVKVQQTYGPNFRGGMVPCDEGEWINVKDLLAWLDGRGR